MGRNRQIVAPQPHEIACYGVLVEYDASIMDRVLSKDEKDIDEVNRHLSSLMEPTKGLESVIGVNTLQQGLMVLVRASDDGADKACVDELLKRYAAIGRKAKVAKERIYADGRYLKEPYAGFVTTLPAYEVEREIVRILEENCHDWSVYEDRKSGLIFWEGDLGGRKVTIAVQNGDWQLSAGLANGDMHYTREVRKHWLAVLKGLEGDIAKWRDEHPGLAKKRASA